VRNVALIVRRELASYVRTPSGWIIAAITLLFEAVIFNAYAIGTEAALSTDVLLRFLEVAGGTTVFMTVIFSMRLLAEDRYTGTHVLLFTSPVREGEIVLAKYLAALVVVSAVVLLSLYLPALIFVNGKVSYGHIAAGYFGMILLAAATLSIGMFASSLTSHPFLAVFVAGGIALLLEACWWVARIADVPFMSEVLGWMAPYYKHYQPFRRGIVQLSDIVFFASVIYVSLLASTRMLKTQRWQ
jgi:ABC-2 type transport system permease protein